MLGNCYLEKNYKAKLNAAFLVKTWSYHFGLSMMVLGTKLLHAPGVKLNLGRNITHKLQEGKYGTRENIITADRTKNDVTGRLPLNLFNDVCHA